MRKFCLVSAHRYAPWDPEPRAGLRSGLPMTPRDSLPCVATRGCPPPGRPPTEPSRWATPQTQRPWGHHRNGDAGRVRGVRDGVSLALSLRETEGAHAAQASPGHTSAFLQPGDALVMASTQSPGVARASPAAPEEGQLRRGQPPTCAGCLRGPQAGCTQLLHGNHQADPSQAHSARAGPWRHLSPSLPTGGRGQG